MKGNEMSRTKKPVECVVVIEKITPKTGEPTISTIDAAGIPAMSPADVVASASTMESLCLNFLAGNVHPDIVTAGNERGGLVKAFPKLANADRDAIRKLLAASPDDIRNGWARHVAATKRIRGITLQALRKGIADPAVPKASLKDSLAGWCANNSIDKLPQSLADIFIEFDLVTMD